MESFSHRSEGKRSNKIKGFYFRINIAWNLGEKHWYSAQNSNNEMIMCDDSCIYRWWRAEFKRFNYRASFFYKFNADVGHFLHMAGPFNLMDANPWPQLFGMCKTKNSIGENEPFFSQMVSDKLLIWSRCGFLANI